MPNGSQPYVSCYVYTPAHNITDTPLSLNRAQALPAFTWDSPGHVMTSLIKVVLTVLAVFIWPALFVYPYEAAKQRPEARKQVRAWFKRTLMEKE